MAKIYRLNTFDGLKDFSRYISSQLFDRYPALSTSVTYLSPLPKSLNLLPLPMLLYLSLLQKELIYLTT